MSPGRIESTAEQAASYLLTSMLEDKLAVVVGAGLSMSPPSSLPSAQSLARTAAARHALVDPMALAGIQGDLGKIAKHFFDSGQLDGYFVHNLLDATAFFGESNPGHVALADFMICSAVWLTVSTNVDVLIESAAERLRRSGIPVALSGTHLAAESRAGSPRPLLKIHGCWRADKRTTVWCEGQTLISPIAERLQSTTVQLTSNLAERDLLILGFWTDWNYLNKILEQAISGAASRRVIVVDPATEQMLATKAPRLWEWIQQRPHSVIGVSGAEFLHTLRLRFSRYFLDAMLASATTALPALEGAPTTAMTVNLDGCTAEELYELRRDAEGRTPAEGAVMRVPANNLEGVGSFMLSLAAAGAVVRKGMFEHLGRRIRVVGARSPGELLSMVKARYEASADVERDDATHVVCVGADPDGGAPTDFVRPAVEGTVVRPRSNATWVTSAEARSELGGAS